MLQQFIPHSEPTTQSHTRTKESLRLLEDEVRSAPDLTGIPVERAISLIQNNLGHTISPDGLYAMIKRNYPLHTIMYANKRIMLRRDIVRQIIFSRIAKSKTKSSRKRA